jgi:hypothetical protein
MAKGRGLGSNETENMTPKIGLNYEKKTYPDPNLCVLLRRKTA